MYLPTSQADPMGVQDGLVDIQLDSGDQLKKGALLFCHLFSDDHILEKLVID